VSDRPFLSIVVTGRNDDYGGQFARRFFRVLAFNLEQLADRQVEVEVRLVEWNPIQGRPLLAQRLLTSLPARVRDSVTTYVVDGRYQDALSLNPRLKYLEYFAKNVGIRRAAGRFVLATNTDILFGEALVNVLASGALHEGRVYRANRIDLKLGIDDSEIHHALLENTDNHVPRPPIKPPLYAGATGDFVLLDKQTFDRIRGFNEIYRLARVGVDHNLLVKARSSGVPIADIGAPVYHVSHTTSFQVARNQASDSEAESLWGRRQWHQHEVIYDNPDGWGLAEAPLTRIDDQTWRVEFDWDAVAPLVDLRRIVLSGMPTSSGRSPV
jgi:hypothetical protein